MSTTPHPSRLLAFVAALARRLGLNPEHATLGGRYRGTLIVSLSYALFVLGVTFGAVYAFGMNAAAPTAVLWTAAVLVLFIPPLVWRGATAAAGRALLLLLILTMTLAAYFSGGFGSVPLLWAPAVPVMAVVLLGRHKALGWGLAIIAILVGFYVLDLLHWQAAAIFPTAGMNLLEIVVLVTLAAFLFASVAVYEAQGVDLEQRHCNSEADLDDLVRRRTAELARSNAALQVEVAERRRVEAALRASEQTYKLLTENLRDVVMTISTTGRLTYCSPAVREFGGYDPEEETGSFIAKYFARRQDILRGLKLLRDASRSRGPATIEFLYRPRVGEPFWVEVTGKPVLKQGRMVALQCVMRDISDRKQVEQALREAKAAAEAAAAEAATKNLDLETHARQLRAQQAELVNLNAELQSLVRLAESASRSKTEFLANVSHEIRTPMTAIIGFADMLLDDAKANDADTVQALQTIKRNGDYLLNIVNDILDLSKIEAGKMTVESVACDLPQLVREVEAMMRVRADAKNLPFEVNFVGPVPQAFDTDPTRLRQILVNVLGNAIKFTEVGSVRLNVRYEAEAEPHVICDVFDTGVGMTPEQIDRVFQPFVQADASTTRRFGGTGLGLVISRRFADMLGGELAVVRSEPECGTHVRISVAATNASQLVTDPGAECDRVAETPAAHGRVDGRRVLLAEDGPDNQRLITALLRRAGATVDTVDNGAAAVERLSRDDTAYDVVLMDMQMPVLDGYDATRQLRARGYGGRIVALTAHAMAHDRDRCLAAGCDDYVSKPIDRVKLIDAVSAHTEKEAAS